MPPSTRLPTLHLYRHLLREVSYLPPSATPFIRTQLTTSFRKHAADPPPTTSGLTAYRLRKAHTNLRTLRAANAGQVLLMEHILHLAHGRTGRRRRILVDQLLHSKSQSANTTSTSTSISTSTSTSTSLDTEDLARRVHERHARKLAILSQYRNKPSPDKNVRKAAALRTRLNGPARNVHPPPTEPDWLEAWDLPALHALAASQAARKFASPKPELHGANSLVPTDRDIPAMSIWGKPLTPKLARTKLRKWYRLLVKRVMPPVGRGEWEMLGALARGGGEWKMPARRAKVVREEGGEEGVEKKWDWEMYATAPVRSLERAHSRNMKARFGEVGSAPYALGAPIGMHSYDRQRMWQRLYLKLWEATPVMEEKVGPDGKRTWAIQWGGVKRDAQKALPKQMGFFENIPKGMVVSGKNKQRKAVR